MRLHRLFIVLILPLLCRPLLLADKTADQQKIDTLSTQIDSASERGDYTNVQQLRLELATWATGAGFEEIAARQYELLLAARPRKTERVKWSVQLGHLRMTLKDYSRAIQAYDDALHDDPKDWHANLARARAFTAADLHSRAIEAYSRCIKLRPDDAVPYEEIAGVYEKRGFLNKAISFYEQALTRNPKPQLYLNIADCYAHQKNTTKAIFTLSHAKERLPRADYDVRLGEIYQSLGDPARAVQAWEDALKTDPQRQDVRLRLVMLYDQLGRRADTDRVFQELTAKYPGSPLVHYLKALKHFERGEKAAAQQEALRVQELAPTAWVAHFNELLLEEMKKRS